MTFCFAFLLTSHLKVLHYGLDKVWVINSNFFHIINNHVETIYWDQNSLSVLSVQVCWAFIDFIQCYDLFENFISKICINQIILLRMFQSYLTFTMRAMRGQATYWILYIGTWFISQNMNWTVSHQPSRQQSPLLVICPSVSPLVPLL